ncbi:alpha/beta hydrolase family protein [Luteimonas panaciterrae]|uniref:alpha/beta hydrolase family protein n=1 Tax=Luteimonas panaciterrae TaxID=363885 RepID=UPI001CFBCFF4|nr:alpha/beta fold hydrolase [Luteimonas panaciterrae]
MNDTATPEVLELPQQAEDGHRFALLARIPANPQRSLLWLPALGIAAKHYIPFAEALARRGVAVFVHEWRGLGTSSLRAGHDCNWDYRDVLYGDLPLSEAAVVQTLGTTPRIIGGHSLGGQFACMRLGLAPRYAHTLWLTASAAPYWRAYPMPYRLGLPLAYRAAPWYADRHGYLPGYKFRFAGNEARGLIRDWASTGLSGRYAFPNIADDLEAAMAARDDVSARAIVMADDWLAPEPPVRFLLSKLPRAQFELHKLGATELGTRADHFAWMKAPEAVAAWLSA